MKRVSFEVAKAIAKAGYWCKYGHRCEVQEIVDSERLLLNVDYSLLSMGVPTYLDVWLWLWREKNNRITVLAHDPNGALSSYRSDCTHIFKINDPEEVIIAAIKDLVDNDLIK